MLTPRQEELLQIEAGNLQRAGASMPEILDVVKAIAAKLECDDACQKRKKIDELRKTWINSLNQYNTLPNIIDTNEQKYFDLAEGPDYYKNNVLKPKYIHQATENLNNEREKLESINTNFNSLLNGYSGETIALNRLKQLEDDLIEKNKSLRTKIDNHYKSTLTNERKVFYEIDEVSSLKYYNKILFIIYFVILCIYIIFGPFFRKGLYKKYTGWIHIIFYIVLPFTINWLIGLFYTIRAFLRHQYASFFS